MTLAAAAAFLLAATNASALVMVSEHQSIWVPGSMETQPWDINNAGVVVGGYRLHDGGGFHGFIYSAGAFTTVDAPGTDSTVFYGINDAGEIVGEAGGSALTTAFKYVGGAFHPIDVPGAVGVVATDINNAGQVIGNYLTGSLEDGLEAHLFLQTGASIDTFPGSHGAAWSEALADDGSFAGFDNIGFLHHEGDFSDFGTDLLPRGLNNLGNIVGQTRGAIDGFLLADGEYTPFDVVSNFTVATGISTHGNIVGYFHDFTDGNEKGFLISKSQVVPAQSSPVPEPAIWAALALAFIAIGAVARRSRGAFNTRIRAADSGSGRLG